MYAGAVSGGIWKTTNGGSTWTPLNDFMSNIAIMTMAFDPSVANRSVIYAGTGELQYSRGDGVSGAGVFKSTDSGASWSQLSSTSSWTAVPRIAVSGTGTVLAAAKGGIFRSVNGGQSWSQVFTCSDSSTTGRGLGLTVTFDPNNSSKAVAEVVDYDFSVAAWRHKILYSTNGGVTWLFAGMPAVLGDYYDHVELAYSVSATGVVYANTSSNSGQIWKSLDGGQSYALVTAQGVTGCYSGACSLWVSPIDSNFLITGSAIVSRSTDGGATITSVGAGLILSGEVHPDIHRIIESPAFSASNRRVYFCTDGGIFKTDDISTAAIGGGNWTDLNSTYQTAQFHGVAANWSANPVYMGGTQDNGTLLTSNAASNATLVNDADGGAAAIDPTDPRYVYSESIYLDLNRSTSAGATGSSIRITHMPGQVKPLSDAQSASRALFIAPFVLDPRNTNTMYAGGLSLWRSTNIKANIPDWDAIRSPGSGPLVAIAVAKSNPAVVWVAEVDRVSGLYPSANGTISKTSNAGSVTPAWNPVRTEDSLDGLPPLGATSIYIDPDDESIVYLTFGGFLGTNVWRTRDGGAHWSPINGSGLTALPAVPVRAIAPCPRNSNVLFVGTEVGLYESDDAGATWSPSQQGPNDAPIYDLKFVYGSDQLLLGTHGRGLWTADTSAVSTYAPMHLVATASGTTVVNVSWDAYPGAASYQLLKSSGGAPYAPITVAGVSYSDANVSPGAAYLYRVRAVLAGGALTDRSNVDLATTVVFTDDGALTGKTITAVHLQELRSATNMVLIAAGLPQVTWGNITSGVTAVQANDVVDIRSALLNAYYAVGLSIPVFNDAIATGVTVKATHFQELRNLVK